MGIVSFFRQLFGKKAQEETPIESSVARSVTFNEEKPLTATTLQSTESTPQEDVLKDSFQLGLAAGYTGKSIKEIESSLNRIESNMTTKDWFALQFEDRTPELIELLKKQEENNQKRFEILQNLILSHKLPMESTIIQTIPTIPRPEGATLTQKMHALVLIVKEQGEMSYKDLAARLGITVSALRGLLSNTVVRTSNIERFRRDGKGWVKYKAINA